MFIIGIAAVIIVCMCVHCFLLKACYKKIYKFDVFKNSAFIDLIRCQVVRSYRSLLINELHNVSLEDLDVVEEIIYKKGEELIISFNGKKKE